MNTLIIPSLITTILSTPLELHYLDEYSLFVVFLTEIMYVFYGISDSVASISKNGHYYLTLSILPNCFVLHGQLMLAKILTCTFYYTTIVLYKADERKLPS